MLALKIPGSGSRSATRKKRRTNRHQKRYHSGGRNRLPDTTPAFPRRVVLRLVSQRTEKILRFKGEQAASQDAGATRTPPDTKTRHGPVAAAQEGAEQVSKVSQYLRRLSAPGNIVLRPDDGLETLEGNKRLFKEGFDDVSYATKLKTDASGPATALAEAIVHEMSQCGTWQDMFQSLTPDLDKLCLNHGQIIQIRKEHKRWIKMNGFLQLISIPFERAIRTRLGLLRPEDTSTFFLMKKNDKYVVVEITWFKNNKFKIQFHDFTGKVVWPAENLHRVITGDYTVKT